MTQEALTQLAEYLRDLVTVIVPVLMFVTAVSFVVANMRRGLKLSLRIAVIGMPRAGKTTLIVKVFDRVMSGKYARFITVNGVETIERINAYLSTLRSGLNLGPTLEKDVFAFRFVYNRKFLGFFPVKYDVEVADFPGEYSSELSSSDEKTASAFSLYRKEFFSWVVRADRYVFAIDAAAFAGADPEGQHLYVVEMAQKIKTSVLLLKQELLDESVYSRPCALVFTKCDALFKHTRDDIKPYENNGESDQSKRHNEFLNIEEQLLLDAFSDLYEFLKNNFRTTRVIFHSSVSDNPKFLRATDNLIRHMSPL